MDKQDKESLMKDLCARLQYGVQVFIDGDNEPYALLSIHPNKDIATIGLNMDGVYATRKVNIGTIKPYLRSMSSMTEEEKMYVNELIYDKDGLFLSPIPTWVINECDIDKYIDFCNSNHLDWRGLIPMGLALPALDGMYNF